MSVTFAVEDGGVGTSGDINGASSTSMDKGEKAKTLESSSDEIIKKTEDLTPGKHRLREDSPLDISAALRESSGDLLQLVTATVDIPVADITDDLAGRTSMTEETSAGIAIAIDFDDDEYTDSVLEIQR
jgi:hypothetical protein